MDEGTKKDDAPAPPPTYSGVSPIPQPLPPRKTRKQTQPPQPTRTETPLFQRRGDVKDDPEPRAAYQDISEDDSDDELPDGKLQRWFTVAKRSMRKSAAFLSYQAQTAQREVKTYAHKALLTDKHLEDRFHNGATLTDLLYEGYSLDRTRRVLGFETIDDLVQLELSPPFKTELWSTLIAEPYQLHWSDLEKFDLHNLEEYVKAGLTAEQLHQIGTDLNELVSEGRFTRECMVAVAQEPYFWNLDNYHVFGIDYNVFQRLQLQKDDYPQLLRCQGWQLAEYLGLYDSSTKSATPEQRLQLSAINIDV